MSEARSARHRGAPHDDERAPHDERGSARRRRGGSAAVLVLLVLLVEGGCGGITHGAGDRPPGFRLVSGTLQIPDASSLGRQTTGLQIAGIAVGTPADTKRVDAFPSPVIDVSHVQTARLSAPVDGKRSFVVVLQVPSASARGPGALVATLEFDGETLLPPGLDDIELGVVHVEGTSPADAKLVVGDANDPLAQIDTDGDGTPDKADDDDDGDGVPDASDTDAGGDGVDDALQLLSAIPDEDGDGVPDLLQP